MDTDNKRVADTRPKTLGKRRKRGSGHSSSDSSPDEQQMRRQAPPSRYGGANKAQSDRKLLRYMMAALFHQVLFLTGTFENSDPKRRQLQHSIYWADLRFLGIPFKMYKCPRAQKKIASAVKCGVDDLLLLDKVKFTLRVFDENKIVLAVFVANLNWRSNAVSLGKSMSCSKSNPIHEPGIKILFRRLMNALTARWENFPDGASEKRTFAIVIDDEDVDTSICARETHSQRMSSSHQENSTSSSSSSSSSSGNHDSRRSLADYTIEEIDMPVHAVGGVTIKTSVAFRW